MNEENPKTDIEKSETDKKKPETDKQTSGTGLLQTLASAVLSGIPVLSAIVFLAVAIKVFRASNMETVTTVAIVSSADAVALLKGVILTLLPGFLAGVVAAAIWWWSRDLVLDPESSNVTNDAKSGLHNPRLSLVWIALVIAFYTISWPILVVFLVPVAVTTVLLFGQSRRRWTTASWTKGLLGALRMLSAVAAIVAILFVALSPTVWLPLRAIDLKPGYSAEINGKALPPRFAAFVLSSNNKTTSLLLNSPRGVVEISTNGMQPNPPLCILPVSRYRWLFLRASQVVHADHDFGSPYEICP